MINIGDFSKCGESLLLNPVILPVLFDEEDLTNLYSLIDVNDLVDAKVLQSKNEEVVEGVRKCSEVTIRYTDKSAWLYGWIADTIKNVNDQYFHFDPLEIVEEIAFVRYQEGGHYDVHFDIDTVPPMSGRKLSVVIQLSDETEYEGGSLTIVTNAGPIDVPKAKGTMVIFPSYLPHLVNIVTSGRRDVLVMWAGGQHFR